MNETRHCSVCKKPQYHTTGGWTCPDGHGGADPIENVVNPEAPPVDVLKMAANKPTVEEVKMTFNQLILALELGAATATIARDVSLENNSKTIILSGRVGAMELNGQLNLVRDKSLKDYLG